MAVSVGSSAFDFQSYMEGILRHLDIRGVDETIVLGLRGDYEGGALIEGFARERGTAPWTPLSLAQALAGFKDQVGGDAKVLALGPGFIELSQSRCEFGEPREGANRGNLCEVCMGVVGAAARASGIADEGLPKLSSSIADGDRACNYTVGLR